MHERCLMQSTRTELLGSGEEITGWMDAVVNATKPQFDEVHVVLSAFVKQLQRWHRYGLRASPGISLQIENWSAWGWRMTKLGSPNLVTVSLPG